MKHIIKSITPIFLIILPLVILSNCHSTRKTATTEKRSSTKGRIENFDEFYNKFHKDSVFQVSRTKFPLGGMSVSGSEKTKWTRTNLPLLKIKVYDIDTTQYKISIKRTANSVIQKVWIEDSGFKFECRFKLIDNKWFLVYVLDQIV